MVTKCAWAGKHVLLVLNWCSEFTERTRHLNHNKHSRKPCLSSLYLSHHGILFNQTIIIVLVYILFVSSTSNSILIWILNWAVLCLLCIDVPLCLISNPFLHVSNIPTNAAAWSLREPTNNCPFISSVKDNACNIMNTKRLLFQHYFIYRVTKAVKLLQQP